MGFDVGPSEGSFGALLRGLRHGAGLSQEDLAHRAGLSSRTVSDLERGVHATARLQTLRLLAHALGLSGEERDLFLLRGRGGAPAARDDPGGAADRLPTPPTPLLERDRERVALAELLTSTDVRMVTLTGVGGVGKTRLALGVAHAIQDSFPDGVRYVPLAGVTSTDLVAPAIARVVGPLECRPDGDEVHTLARVLQAHSLLLVIDNFEHLLPAAVLIADLLDRCPRLRVLATSRSPLRLRAEVQFRVEPLAVRRSDDPVSDLADSPAARLFLNRMTAAGVPWRGDAVEATAVTELCRRLDGIPLAIELAARHTTVLPPVTLLSRLVDPLNLLMAGPRDLPARQRTLRDTLAWSYDLLDSDGQRLFRRLAVFVGGCTVDAARAVCGEAQAETGLSVLVDASLLQPASAPAGTSRLAMLDTVRGFAREHLCRSGELAAVQERHAHAMLEIGERAAPRLAGHGQADAFDLLEAEHGNLIAALAWSVENGEFVLGLRLAIGLWRFWEARGHVREGRDVLGRLLAHDRPAVPRRLWADALHAAGHLDRHVGDTARALDRQAESLRIAEGLADPLRVARARHGLATIAFDRGDVEKALAGSQRALRAFCVLRDRSHAALALRSLGMAASRLGRTVLALRAMKGSHRLYADLGDVRGSAGALCGMAGLLAADGRRRRAAALFEAALRMYLKLGDRHGIVLCLEGLAIVAVDDGHIERAVQLLGAGEGLREHLGEPVPAARRPEYARAVATAREALARRHFEDLWAVGRARSVEQAVTHATMHVAASRRPSPAPHANPAVAAVGDR